MTTASIRLDGLAIELTADDRGHLDWLYEFYSTLPTADAARPDARVEVIFDPARLAAARADAALAPRLPGFTFTARDGRIPRWTRGEEKHAFDPELDALFQVRGPSIQVVGGAPGTARVALMRVVRELHERWLVTHGFVLLHAAAAAVEGRIVLIAGPRESGKSTLLTYLLAHGGAAFLSNDRTAVDGAGRVVAVPTIVSIRSTTPERVPGLPPIPWSSRFLHRHRIAELEIDAGDRPSPRRSPPSFSPAQYRSWLGVPAARGGHAAAIVFPGTTGGRATAPLLERMPSSEAAARLAEARIQPGEDGLLADDGSAPSTVPDFDLSAPRSLPAYRCRLGGYPVDGARALLERMQVP